MTLMGEYVGGPAYYIEKGLNNKAYAYLFAFAAIIGCGICIPQPPKHIIFQKL